MVKATSENANVTARPIIVVGIFEASLERVVNILLPFCYRTRILGLCRDSAAPWEPFSAGITAASLYPDKGKFYTMISVLIET